MTIKVTKAQIDQAMKDNPDLSRSICKDLLNAKSKIDHLHSTPFYDFKKCKRTKGLENSTNPKDLNFGKKPTLSLVPGTFIIHTAVALEDGAKKRSPYNYREDKVSAMQLIDKIERHMQLIKDRHDYADDSGLHELAHAAANIAVYLDAMEQGTLVDDRPVVGKTYEVMKRYTKS